MKNHTPLLLLTLILLGGLTLTYFFFLTNTAPVSHEQIFGTHEKAKPLLIAPTMKTAFTNEEKQKLGESFKAVMTALDTIKQQRKVFDTGTIESPSARVHIKQFDQVFYDTARMSVEINNELQSTAESLDDKVASFVAQAIILHELSTLLKKDLTGSVFQKTAHKFTTPTAQFLTTVDTFKTAFFNALVVDLINPDIDVSQDIINAFVENPVNEQELAKYHEYDSRTFFQKIEKETLALETHYHLATK